MGISPAGCLAYVEAQHKSPEEVEDMILAVNDMSGEDCIAFLWDGHFLGRAFAVLD